MLNYNNWKLMDVNGIDKPTYGHHTDGRSLEDPSQMGYFPANHIAIFDDQTLQEALLLNPQFFWACPFNSWESLGPCSKDRACPFNSNAWSIWDGHLMGMMISSSQRQD